MKIEKRQIQYNVENFISRLPGLFTYMEEGKTYKATTAPMGCYGKYVCDLRLDFKEKDVTIPKIQEDEYGNLLFTQEHLNGNFSSSISLPVWEEEIIEDGNTTTKNEAIILKGGETYSYRTIIGIYNKYKVIKETFRDKYFKEYFKDENNNERKIIKTKLNRIKTFLDFVDKGIGCYSVEELVEQYNNVKKKEERLNFNYNESTLIPSIIYLATASNLLNEMKILQSSCEFYKDITDEEKKKEFNEFCCECQKFRLKGGDDMITLLEYCVEKANDTANEYYDMSIKKLNFNVPVSLHLSMSEMGIYQQFSNVWDSTRGYKRGDIVTYDNETYICVGAEDDNIFTDKDENGEIIYYGIYNEYDIIEFPYEAFKLIKDCKHYISENNPYEDEDIALNNVLGGQSFDIKDDNGDILKEYRIEGKTSSRLSGLRSLKTFIENNVDVRPYGSEDWLFYYQKGVVNNEKITDRLANLVKIENSKEIISNNDYVESTNNVEKLAFQNNFYIYGDCIDDICFKTYNDKLYIEFQYTINAHLRPTNFNLETDEAGNELLYYRDLVKDGDSKNGKYHGITYTEMYYIEKDENVGSLWNLTQNKEYFLIPSGTNLVGNDGNTYSINDFLKKGKVEETKEDENEILGFCKVYYTFYEYVNNRTVILIKDNSEISCKITIPDTKKYAFEKDSNSTTYEVNTLNGKTQINDIISEYSVTIENKVDYEYNNLYKEDYLMGIHHQPYVSENVYIDRGNADAYESYLKLMEVKTMQDLENYQNGGFFNIEKMS